MGTRGGEMELNQDLVFQRREWTVQRIGWWALSVFVLAALLGAFGNGPLSRARAGEPGAPLWVEYERFTRVGAASRMYVHLGTTAESGREVRLNRRYFDNIRVDVLPEPERVEIGPDDVTFYFNTEQAPEGATIVLDVEPLNAGRQSIRISTRSQAGQTFTQFAYF